MDIVYTIDSRSSGSEGEGEGESEGEGVLAGEKSFFLSLAWRPRRKGVRGVARWGASGRITAGMGRHGRLRLQARQVQVHALARVMSSRQVAVLGQDVSRLSDRAEPQGGI